MKNLHITIICFLALACLSFLLHWQGAAEIPKLGRSGTAGLRLGVAEDFVRASENPEFAGNTDDATEFAEHFTVSLRSHNLASPSLPIRTYCYMQKDTVAILTDSSGLWESTESKKREVEEFAWGDVNDYASKQHPDLKKRALCFMNEGKFLLLLSREDSKETRRLDARTDVDRVLIMRQLLPFFEQAK